MPFSLDAIGSFLLKFRPDVEAQPPASGDCYLRLSVVASESRRLLTVRPADEATGERQLQLPYSVSNNSTLLLAFRQPGATSRAISPPYLHAYIAQ